MALDNKVLGAVRRAVLFVAVLVMGLATNAKADLTYTYTGNAFNTFSGTYSCLPECRITGWMTLTQPLGDNLNTASVTPTAFSFTDGNTTWTNNNVLEPNSAFDFSTDALGNITAWDFGLQIGYSYSLSSYNSTNHPFPIDDSFTQVCCWDHTGEATISGDPGAWAVAPEPSSFVLLSTGLIAFGSAARRKWRSKLRHE